MNIPVRVKTPEHNWHSATTTVRRAQEGRKEKIRLSLSSGITVELKVGQAVRLINEVADALEETSEYQVAA